MYLKKLSIEHFRKFGDVNNTIQFAASKDYKAEKYLNIAPKTTLIVGKNNSGKTTIVEVLRRLLEQTDFRATDFNFDYLQTLLISYTPRKLKNGKIKFPTMKFVLTIGIDNDDPDLLTNIAPFITLGEVKNSEVIIKAVWSPADEELFLRQHRTIAEASAVESPIRQETIGFPAHFFARAHNFKPPGRACQPEADSPMRT